MNALRLYVRYIAASARTQMQYRVSFGLQCLAHFLVTGGEYLAIWSLFDRFGRLGDWRLEEVALLYGTVSMSYAWSDALCGGLEGVGPLVKSGGFDRLLLRPRTLLLQLLGQELRIRVLLGRGAQALIVLLWAVASLKDAWSPAHSLLLLGAIAGGGCLFLAIRLLHATWSFWTIESLEFMELLAVGGSDAARYPLSIYDPWLRHFLTYVVPVAAVTYFPIVTILGRAEQQQLPGWLGWISPVVGLLCLAVATRVWRFGVRRYQSTGS